jgi:hypothetical protein
MCQLKRTRFLVQVEYQVLGYFILANSIFYTIFNATLHILMSTNKESAVG